MYQDWGYSVQSFPQVGGLLAVVGKREIVGHTECWWGRGVSVYVLLKRIIQVYWNMHLKDHYNVQAYLIHP